ncbi:protoplast secreted protein 2 precursor [Mucor ambiguus]|uniref:Protoplast secreted protein 2 n=1 Tax=Mucor ambiguus TaxID=91626 RepID=A0A0C9N3H3_9FUNG|nr:protoplast secreted protein 2 precursor [Mucor ambiguus]
MTKPVVYIVLYSLYQHVYKLSQSIQQGLEEKGVEVKVFQVAETLSDEILSKMQAPAKPDLPIMTVDKLAEPDGIIFGLPTRFGLFPAQIKTLLDASGALWAKGALAGKFAGTFFSTASQHGGQETTALTAVTYFAHHGMMYVPFGYANVALQNNDEVIGGSAYGSGTISDGDGSRQPTQTELDIAKNQGQNFAVIVSTFVKGRVAIEGAAPDINNKLADGNVNGSTAPSDPATTTTSNATGAGVAAGAVAAGTAAGAAGASSALGNAAPANAKGGVPKDTAGNASTAPADTTLDANNGPATPVHGITNEGNAAPTNAIAGTPSAPAGNAAAAAAANTTTNDASTAPTADKTTAVSTEPTTTTTGNAANTTATDNAPKVGASAGATAAGAASAVPNNLKDNKPKKKKKWFCC